MAGISLAAINKYLDDYAKSEEGKKRMGKVIADYRKHGVDKTAAGDEVADIETMKKVAEDFISILSMKAESYRGQGDGAMPYSVVRHFNSLTCKEPVLQSDGSYSIDIVFQDDLSRESLDRGYDTSGGIENIVALFNNGVKYQYHVYGWWDGHEPIGAEAIYRSGPNAKSAFVRSKKDRPGLHFIQEAVDEFEAKYKEKYDATATPNGIYEIEPGNGSAYFGTSPD